MRERLPDLLRGLALVAMIQVHVTELLLHPAAPAALVSGSLFLGGPSAAPLFLVIMGYFAWRKSPGWVLARRGLALIGGGLLLNVGLNASLLWRWWQGEWVLNPWHYLLGADLLPLAGLSLMVLAVLPRRPLPWCYALVAVLAAHFWLDPLLAHSQGPWRYLAAFIGGDISWSYFPLLPWLAYPLAGGLFAAWRRQGGAVTGHRWLGPLALGLLASLPWAGTISSDLSAYYHHGAVFVLWALAWTALLAGLGRWWLATSQTSGAALQQGLQWLGQRVTRVYVVQWLLLGNVATWWYRQAPAWSWPLWVLAALALTVIVVMLLDRLLLRASAGGNRRGRDPARV